MKCLACGDCCNRMSPRTGGKCDRVVELEPSVFVCGDYMNRPEQCVSHDFPCPVCPVGMNTLGIRETSEIELRLELIRKLLRESDIF